MVALRLGSSCISDRVHLADGSTPRPRSRSISSYLDPSPTDCENRQQGFEELIFLRFRHGSPSVGVPSATRRLVIAERRYGSCLGSGWIMTRISRKTRIRATTDTGRRRSRVFLAGNRTVRRWRLRPLWAEGCYRPLHTIFRAGSRPVRHHGNCIVLGVIASGRIMAMVIPAGSGATVIGPSWRLGTVEDCAKVVEFLATDLSAM
jgi:hypothetical protein